MVFRISPYAPRQRVAALLVSSLIFGGINLGSSVDVVQAGSVDSARRKVQQMADQLEAAEEEVDRLGEELRIAEDDKAQLEEEIESTLAEIAAKEAELDGVELEMSNLAVEAFVGGSRLGSLSGLLAPGGGPNESVQKQYLTEIALNVAFGNSDKLDALITDLNDLRKKLERDRKQAEELAVQIKRNREAAEDRIAKYTALKASAEKELGQALAEERARRAAEAAAAARSRAAAFAAQRGDPSNTRVASFDPSSVPPSSSRATIAVVAAQSQIGVKYRYATAIEGVSFDCSGLTMWAWRQAGVGLPHQSRAQYRSSPQVPIAYLEPGDLVFFYRPITHVGIYVGGGMMVDAPGVGRPVRITPISWNKVVGATRPG